MTAKGPSPDLPSFDPQETEHITDIPPRFLVDGYLKLRADGAWLFKGDKIDHPGLQAFLSRQLRRTEEGKYWVVNGPQRALVELEDAPYVVKRLLFATDDPTTSPMTLRLNDGTEEPLDPTDLFANEEGVLYVSVKEGQAGAHEDEAHIARFSSPALMDIEPLLIEQPDGTIALQHNQRTYPLHHGD